MMVGDHFWGTESVFNIIFILIPQQRLQGLYIVPPNPMKWYHKTFKCVCISQEVI